MSPLYGKRKGFHSL